jgi:hypothetical protein
MLLLLSLVLAQPTPAPLIPGLRPERAPSLGTPLRQDGYFLRPPQGFVMGRMELFQGTRALAVSRSPFAEKRLSAALVDGEGEDAAALVIAIVEAPFEASPSSRDELSASVMNHFNEELGLKLLMERAELLQGPPSRIEVLGTLRQEDQVRTVLVTAISGTHRHAVITASAPSGRWASIAPAVRACLDTFRYEGASAGQGSRGLAWGLVMVVGLALIASLVALWQRRRGVKAVTP